MNLVTFYVGTEMFQKGLNLWYEYFFYYISQKQPCCCALAFSIYTKTKTYLELYTHLLYSALFKHIVEYEKSMNFKHFTYVILLRLLLFYYTSM